MIFSIKMHRNRYQILLSRNLSLCLPSNREKGMGTNKKHIGIIVLTLAAAILIGIVVGMASVPPVSRDALNHHLLVPKLYLAHGGIYEIPHILFSYYPMNLDLLYAIPLFFGNDILPKIIHLTFGLLTALVLFNYLRKRLGATYAAIGGLLFLSLPVIVRLSTVAYVDLGLLFFSTVSLMAFVKWTENGFAERYLVLSAVFCGLCMGTKYNGLIVLCLVFLMTAFVYVRRNRLHGLASAKAFLPAALFLFVAVAVFSPWAIRNALWTGNPVYPLFQSIFNPPATAGFLPDVPASPRLDHFSYRRLAFGEPWWMIVLVPIRIFLQGADDNPQFFDGALNPYLLVLPLLALLTWRAQPVRHRRENTIWLVFAVLYILIVFFQIDMRTRWILPAVPPLVILSVFGLHGVAQKIRSVLAVSSLRGNLMGGAFAVVLLCMLALNVRYLADLYGRVSPMEYLSGRMSRDEYIVAHRPEYELFRYANRHLPQGASLLSFFMGGRFYYSDLPVQDGNGTLLRAIRDASSPESIATRLTESGHEYLLIYEPLLNRWLTDNLSAQQLVVTAEFFSSWTETLLASKGYVLMIVRKAQQRGGRE
ncbi:MAG: phospholipid carrier-dependent glycosyltransferase [Pseudomonadota bacterium]